MPSRFFAVCTRNIAFDVSAVFCTRCRIEAGEVRLALPQVRVALREVPQRALDLGFGRLVTSSTSSNRPNRMSVSTW